jgi:hypothetical protein
LFLVVVIDWPCIEIVTSSSSIVTPTSRRFVTEYVVDLMTGNFFVGRLSLVTDQESAQGWPADRYGKGRWHTKRGLSHTFGGHGATDS